MEWKYYFTRKKDRMMDMTMNVIGKTTTMTMERCKG
jgi:hypothetical protein